MKRVQIKSITLLEDKIIKGTTLTDIILDNNKLKVLGNISNKFNDVDFSKLRGEDAKKMFYVLAASPVPTYSDVEFTGTTKEEIISYLTKNFSKKDLVEINPYKWR